MKNPIKKFQSWRNQRRQYKIQRVPKVVLPYTQEIITQRRKFQLTFLLIALITSFYTYSHWKQHQNKEALLDVVVAVKSIDGPKVIEASDVEVKKIPRRYLPETFFTSVEEVEGNVIVPDAIVGEVLLQKHFQGKLDPKSISAKFESDYAFTLDEEWLIARMPELRPNDRIDILASNPKGSIDQTLVIAQNIKVIEIQKGKSKRTLVLQMTQEQAQPVIFARGLRLPMQVLVHSSIREESDAEVVEESSDQMAQ